jgi:hypothetical protein
MEPAEGHYAWNEDENYKKLVQGALDRNIKLAFRVVVDSQNVHMQATPQFVFDAGAVGVGANSNPNFKTPRLTDPIFREKFEDFVRAFAKQYDDPSIVDYIDAGGFGYWGEMQTIIPALTKVELDGTFRWVVNLYADNFNHILLGQQDKSAFDWSLQDWAYEEKGFILRRDSYGSFQWFPQADKDRIVARWPDVPVFAENCYQTFVSRASSCDGRNRPIRDMLTRVVNDALYTHANTLDLRHPEDVIEFATNHAELVEKFALEGGYRFVLKEVSYPSVMDSRKPYMIYHSWKNTGVGKLPNDLRNWGYKCKVAFALLDPITGVGKSEYSLDGGGTWQTYSAPISLNQDAKYTVSYRSTDNAGNVEVVNQLSFNLDQSAPNITVTGLDYGTYNDSMMITPVVSLDDNLSGVDYSKTTVMLSTNGAQETVQQGTSIPLYTLPLGTHALTVIASDLAGNTSSQRVMFQTTTSIQSIQYLVASFSKTGWIDNAGIANSLQSKLAANNLKSFLNEVQAQSGKHISAPHANYLIRDVNYLLSPN